MWNIFDDPRTIQPKTLPSKIGPESVWGTELTDCWTPNKSTCLLGTFCSSILGCLVSEKFGDYFLLSHVPCGYAMLRTGIRERYNIKGSIQKDWAEAVCCGPCSLCQMARELNVKTDCQ